MYRGNPFVIEAGIAYGRGPEQAPEGRAPGAWLLPFFRSYTAPLLQALALAAVVGALYMAIPVATQMIVDRVLVGREVTILRVVVGGMLAIFLFAGIGNASTFKQMPMIFERRQAGGVIGWTAAIAAFGPFLFGVGLTIMSPALFYTIGIAWAIMCVVITWMRYARPNAPKPG